MKSYHPIDIQKFQGIVNFIAKKYLLTQEIERISRINPKTNKPYDSPEEFGDVAIGLFRANGVAEPEIRRLVDTITAMKEVKPMDERRFICPNCGSISVPKQQMRGNPWIELILYLVGFCVCLIPIPGIIYSIWRREKMTRFCCFCGCDSGLMPENSPGGQALKKRML